MKPRRTEAFKVTPINIRTGATAPYYILDYAPNPNVNLKENAVKEAKTKSRLNDFDNWNFEVEKV